MKKRIFTLILALCMCLSLSISVSAAMVNRDPEPPCYTVPPRTAEDVEVRLAELIETYNNTYWTSTGAPCDSHRENCYSKYFNAWQCNGFARYIFNELFCGGDIGSYDGDTKYYIPYPRNATEVNRADYVQLGDIDAIKAFLAPAQPGDFFQIFDRETGRPHSMIVVSVDRSGLNVLDCNSDGHCGVKYHLLSWEAMAARYEKLSLYHSTLYPLPANPFTDVADSDWFSGSVEWALENNITSGVTATSFGPNEACTRAQVVTFLWAANGKPAPTNNYNRFLDVSSTDWYYNAVLWAVEKGITSGVTANTFGPDQTCTRAQIVTFLYAAAGKPAAGGWGSFTDVIHTDWYAAAVNWAKDTGITSGITPTQFGPNSVCTRAQVVTFLYKFYG